MAYDYDVIVAGGGMAGLITAASISHFSKQHARILVVDRNPPQDPGKKTINGWTCGDAVSKRSLDYVTDNIGIRYSKPELEHPVDGVLVYSPDHETKVLFEGEGFILNRRLFPKKQVEDAKKLGVEFAFNVACDRLYSEDGFVRGVTGRNLADGSSFKKTAKMVVDAAGNATKLRPNLPIESKIELEIDRDDLESTGRYIFDFESGEEDQTWFDSRYALIHLDQYLAPGGYCLAPDTPIVCQNSLKAIQDIKIGDEVLSSAGWIPVADTSVRQFEGSLIAITPSMLNTKVRLTPEHLVRVWNPLHGEFWKRAEELVRGQRSTRRARDYLVFPLPKPGNPPLKLLDVSEYCEGIREGDYIHVRTRKEFFAGRAKDGSYLRSVGFAKHPKGTKLPAVMKLSREFLELSGWYISEGCIKRGHVTISNTDDKLVQRITGLAKKLGFHYLIWHNKKEGELRECHNVELTNSLLGTLFSKCFGVGAHNKKLPPWVHRLSRGNKLSLLKGMYLGDGSIERRKGGRSDKRCYTTVSRSLSIDLWLLLSSIQVVASIKLIKKKNAWALIVSGHQAGFLGEELQKSKKLQRGGFVIGDGCIYLRIRKLERENYTGPVYDINSAGDFTPLFSVHNCWTFPKGKNKVNIGLGVQKKALDMRNATAGRKDGLQELIDEYVKMNTALKNSVQSRDEEDKGNTKGSWQVSVRRQNDCLVANGFAIVGDAAWMARPIDAGGIGPAIYASVMLGRVIARALETGDLSENGLWDYNLEYMKHHGYQMASFEVLRRYLQTLSNEKISYGMKHFLSEDDIKSIVNREHPKFSRLRLLNPSMMVRIAKEAKLASGLKHTADSSEHLIAHNMNYPEKPEGFHAWKKTLLGLLS